MAPTICSDKKHQTRSVGNSNLRRQARGLQRNSAPTASIINYVAKGVIKARSTAQLRLGANSIASNSTEIQLSSSANNTIRLQEQHYHHQGQQHQQQQQQTQPQQSPLSSKPQISDSLISSTLPFPSSISSSDSINLINTNAEHSNSSTVDFRASSPHNAFSERSMSPYEASESSVHSMYDTDMEDAYDNDDAHSMASDFSDVAIDLSAADDCRQQHKNHQTVFNTPTYGDKQQHTSVIRSTTTNSSATNSNTTNNNNNNSNMMMLNRRDTYYDLCEIKNTEGLLSIAIKTIKLVKRNQMLQRRLAQLQQETSEFIQSVLANPENRNFREKLEQNSQPQLKQQPAE